LRRERRLEAVPTAEAPAPADVDLTTHEDPRDETDFSVGSERVQEFYKANTDEVIARMRRPTTATNNIAASIVLQCEKNARLRAEAERALEIARRAGEARNVLDDAIAVYNSPYRV
jgi:imidazolonepropionase-like amidohydrolase